MSFGPGAKSPIPHVAIFIVEIGFGFLRGIRDQVRVFLAPGGRGHAKAFLEAVAEKPQVAEATFHGHIHNFQRRIPQEGGRLQQAHFHFQGGHGGSEMLLKEPVQMPATAIESLGQIFNGEILEFVGIEFFQQGQEAFPIGTRFPNFRFMTGEDLTKKNGHHLEQVAAMFHVRIAGSGLDQAETLPGHGAVRGKMSDALEFCVQMVQVTQFPACQKGKQLVEPGAEVMPS